MADFYIQRQLLGHASFHSLLLLNYYLPALPFRLQIRGLFGWVLQSAFHPIYPKCCRVKEMLCWGKKALSHLILINFYYKNSPTVQRVQHKRTLKHNQCPKDLRDYTDELNSWEQQTPFNRLACLELLKLHFFYLFFFYFLGKQAWYQSKGKARHSYWSLTMAFKLCCTQATVSILETMPTGCCLPTGWYYFPKYQTTKFMHEKIPISYFTLVKEYKVCCSGCGGCLCFLFLVQ